MDSDHGSGIDHISGLPDELLHDILLRLDLTTPAAAARTSVLSHRWQHVWASLPDLFFGESNEDPQPNYSLDSIDAALAAYSAPKLLSLYITTPMDNELRVPPYQVASWLTFASQHLVDSLYLDIYDTSSYAEEDELELPTCETATEIVLRLPFILRHRGNDIGVFTALTDLNIRGATMDGQEMEDLVSLLCPRLNNLDLSVKLSAESNISIHSATLEQLSFTVEKARRLEVKAPILRSLVAGYPIQTYVAAPNLAKVVWDDFAREEELEFIFADSGRRLRLLDVRDCSAMAPLMRCFDTVHELKLHGLSLGTEEGYQSFLDDIEYLPRCEILHVSSFMGHRCFVPGMLHLLKRVHGVSKLVFDNDPVEFYLSLSACPCLLPEGDMADEINLCSVEEIEINRFTGADEQMKLIDVLTSRCSIAKLQRLEITLADDVTQLSEEMLHFKHAYVPKKIVHMQTVSCLKVHLLIAKQEIVRSEVEKLDGDVKPLPKTCKVEV